MTRQSRCAKLMMISFACCLGSGASASMFDGYNVTANGSAVVNGGSTLLVTDNGSIANSTTWITSPFILTPKTSFTSNFAFQISNDASQPLNEFDPYEGNGGGFFFAIHNCGDATYTGGGDCAQIRANFNADEGNPQQTSQLTIPFGQAQI
jgi:hypothetical protein